MKTRSTLKRGLATIRRAWLAQKYDLALSEAGRLLKEFPDNPHLLVLWADLVQLQDGEDGPTLEDAKAAYRRAVELNPESPEALVGLGHYQNALEDDAKAAGASFAKAISLARSWLRETLLAQAEVLSELGRQQEAFECLAEAHWLQKTNGKAGQGAERPELLHRLGALRRAT